MDFEDQTPEQPAHPKRAGSETGAGWALDGEGTLLVTDAKDVDGMHAPEVKEKTRRIVIQDRYVPQGLFEGFRNCYEAVIDFEPDGYWVEDYAFAHCHSLYWLVDGDGNALDRDWDYCLTCTLPEDCPTHTLLDTPLKTFFDYDILPDFDALEDWSLDAKPRSCLTEGLWGKRFAGLLTAELILMGLLKVPEYGPGNHPHDPVADEWMWFRGCMTALRRGVEAEEPAMLYLAAQCARRIGHRRRESMRADGMDVFEEREAPDLYMAAARAGSPQSLLWCAFCMEEGRYGMRKDPSASREFLEAVRRTQAEDAQRSPVPLWFGELDVMRERFEHLENEILFGDDLEEDRLWEQCGDDQDKYFWEYWNPSWHTTTIRQCHIIDFALDLGAPLVNDLRLFGYPETDSHPRRECYKYDRGNDGLKEAKAALRVERDEWTTWCRSKGISLLHAQAE